MEKMNRISFALFVSLLIHLLFLLILLFITTIVIKENQPKELQENRIKISLKELPTKKTITKKIKQLKTIATHTKQRIKKTIPKQIKPKIVKQPKKIITKPKKVKKPKIIEKKVIKKIDIVKPTINKPLLTPKKVEKKVTPTSWMYEDKSEEDKLNKPKKRKLVRNSSINQNIQKLYGDEFTKLSPAQQKYIVDNTEIMRRITQKVLNRVARVNIKENLNINRTNVIEFYLHPNGDMSDFRFLKQSGYFILDHTTKETIDYAYSRYPRPSEKVLIRYNVMYNLAY